MEKREIIKTDEELAKEAETVRKREKADKVKSEDVSHPELKEGKKEKK